MGYRSDVAYKIEFYDEDQWNVFLIEAKSKPDIRLCFEDQDLEVDYEKYELRFLCEGTKWYSDYPDVKCHGLLLDLCDEYNERLDKKLEGSPPCKPEYVASYLFRRIGEEEDDIESRYGGDPDWGWIELIRYIRVDWQA